MLECAYFSPLKPLRHYIYGAKILKKIRILVDITANTTKQAQPQSIESCAWFPSHQMSEKPLNHLEPGDFDLSFPQSPEQFLQAIHTENTR